MNFWILAVALLAIPAAAIAWPFFVGSFKERMLGMWVLLMMPLAGLLLYQQVGNPGALNVQPVPPQQHANQQSLPPEQQQMDAMIDGLQQRLTENPDDPDGWVMLGRSLKTMQRFAQAQVALSKANDQIPGNAQIMVELAEANLYLSGSSEISSSVREMLETALEIDPQQQKALWLLGMVAAQSGDNESAVAHWQRLLELVDPNSEAAKTINQQIAVALTGTSQAVAELEIPLSITLGEGLEHNLPANAVLFVFLHPAGSSGGMPLAVKRFAAPAFPLLTRLGDADLLRPGTSLSDFTQLDVSARISMTGVANPLSGDYQANVVSVDTQTPTEIALHLDRRVP